MERSELVVVPGFVDNRQLDLCAVSEVLMFRRVAESLAVEALLSTVDERSKSYL
jgi:hypothetical protein